MATDAVHANDLITGIIAELKAHLPANWTQAATVPPAAGWVADVPLKLLQHGDLADEPVEAGTLRSYCPSIFVRCLRVTSSDAASGGGGVDGYTHTMRVVHLRAFDQCRTDAGAAETNQTKARQRYAKLLNQALFNDPYNCMGKPTLATSDTSAEVVMVGRPTWDIGQGFTEEVAEIRNLRVEVWAIAVDFDVTVQVVP